MQTVTTNGGVALSSSDSGGDGVPLVMPHGFQQAKEAFRHQVSGLADSRRVVTLDFRGHGGSDKPRRGYRVVPPGAESPDEVLALGTAARVRGPLSEGAAGRVDGNPSVCQEPARRHAVGIEEVGGPGSRDTGAPRTDYTQP